MARRDDAVILFAVFCADCDKPLTSEEIRYYEYRCETCERAWAERIDRWRHGGEDAEFDQLYGG